MSDKKDFELDLEDLSAVTGGVETAATIRARMSQQANANIAVTAAQQAVRVGAEATQTFRQNVNANQNVLANQNVTIAQNVTQAANAGIAATLEAALEATNTTKIYDK